MPFTTPDRFKGILTALSILRYILKSSGATGTTDAYKHAERFFETVLNLTYGLQLQNMNVMKHNYPAIDLGDSASRVCFQVTGENSSQKIDETIKKFFEHNLNNDYDQLKFLILTTKRSYSKKFSLPIHFDFDVARDVLDVDDVLKEIEAKPSGVINSIYDFVQDELASVLRYFAPKNGLLSMAEPRKNLPAANAGRLLKYMEVEPEYEKGVRKALRDGYRKLTESLSEDLRAYLLVILNRGRIVGSYEKKIGISPASLEGILRIDRTRHGEIYDAVSDLGFADIPEDERPVMLYLTWNTPIDVDLFATFREMFGAESEELKKLIVEADFTLLDT